jgi:hypothetical protein
LQAVRSQTKPAVKVPTDEKYKKYNKKLAKPAKEEVIASREIRSRFIAKRLEEN